MSNAPPIDTRTAADLREQLLQRLASNVPEWSANDRTTQAPDQASAALTGIVARFGEIVIQRLNQVPNKNFLAFLDLLGVSRQPPQPARVALTFTLAPGSVIDAVVPAGTQVAAPPAEGASEPVLFETERELTVVPAKLQSLIAVDAERDMVGDHSALLATAGVADAAVFCGTRRNEHLLYVGHAADLTNHKVTVLIVSVQLNAVPAAAQREIQPADLQWEVWDGTTWGVIPAASIVQPANLNGQFRFSNLPKMPALSVHDISSHWLRCRLLKPVTPGAQASQGMLQAALLPQLNEVKVRATAARAGFTPEAAFANGQALDVTKPFLPFGERPRLGDAFYIASSEAFGLPGASVSLTLPVINPLPPAPAQGAVVPNPVLRWEVWTSSGWSLLGESSRVSNGSAPLADPTRAFTIASASAVTITLPANVVPTTFNGVSGHWIRVQLANGNYGEDARYEPDSSTPPGFRLQPATFVPPMLRSLTLGYSLETADANADLVGYNNLELENLGAGLTAATPQPMFRGFVRAPATLYIALGLPPGRAAFPNRAISLYHALRAFQYGELATPLHPDLSVVDGAAPSAVIPHRFLITNSGSNPLEVTLSTLGGTWSRQLTPLTMTVPAGATNVVTVAVTVPAAQSLGAVTSDRGFLQVHSAGTQLSAVAFETYVGKLDVPRRRVRWEYWNGRGWARLVVADGTDRLARTGLVEFLGPSDFSASRRFGLSGYWIRALLEPGDQPLAPRLRALLPNTIMASQQVSLREEVLGSSDVSENQRFRTLRAPVLLGQQLEVREPGPLPEADRAQLLADLGTAALSVEGGEFWVPWREVADLHGSGPLDRHYVFDHLSGQVRFGDGERGRIPPRGVGNVRMARYQTGGGSRGNCAAGTIVQLKTTVPYVDRVSNIDAAGSGFDAESQAELIARAPRTLRHGGRAVAAEDYEDLARLASAEVARARCVPLRRLREDPLGSAAVPGALSIIVVPRSTDPKPLPSLQLLELTAVHLRARQAANADLSVVGPLYVRVDVAMDVALASIALASSAEREIRARLAAFLHPLTGGREGAGWDFGRQPQLSDLHALVNAVPGVDHIRKLTMTRREDLAGAEATGRFLVYSGQHQIDFSVAGSD